MNFQMRQLAILSLLLLLSIYAKGENTPVVSTRDAAGAFPFEKKVTGRVVDSGGKPLAGTNVVEEGTTNGVVADAGGNYSLSVGEEAT